MPPAPTEFKYSPLFSLVTKKTDANVDMTKGLNRDQRLDKRLSKSLAKNFFSAPGMTDDPYGIKFGHLNNVDLSHLEGQQ
jgi:hypothetical protein